MRDNRRKSRSPSQGSNNMTNATEEQKMMVRRVKARIIAAALEKEQDEEQTTEKVEPGQTNNMSEEKMIEVKNDIPPKQ